MRQAKTIQALQTSLRAWRREGLRIGFVPTMGNLHNGHLALVKAAQKKSDKVVVSIFVNPTQFDKKSEVDIYPRTLDEDIRRLRSLKTDCLFLPSAGDMYPNGLDTTFVDVPGISNILDGAMRPGHFTGVTTVVSKLFNLVQPDIAVFGEKDYQQLLVIRRMVSDMQMPVKIVGFPTVREIDGLAMSSRNGYLNQSQREKAPYLYQVLIDVKRELEQGKAAWQTVKKRAIAKLKEKGFKPEYVDIRCATTLLPAKKGDQSVVILGAAWLGKARLIDNMTAVLNKH